MNRTLKRLLLAVLTGSGLVATTVPAYAVGTDAPVIVNPASRVASGWRGPVTVDFATAPVDDYQLDLSCGGYEYYESAMYNYTGTPETFTWNPPAVTGPQSCTLKVYDTYSNTVASKTFTVAAPPMLLDGVGASVSPFYPLVRDGYRDTSALRYRINQRAKVTAEVKNSDGRTVRTATLGWQGAGSHAWAWNGRRNDGSIVRPGSYRMWVTATNVDGATKRAEVGVKVATATVTKKATKVLDGNQGAPSASSSCRVERDSYYGTAVADCWGGRYAQVSYRFRLPANARNVSWGITGRLSDLDICCDGSVTKSARRASSTSEMVMARVTGWRAYEVSRARVSYTYRAHI